MVGLAATRILGWSWLDSVAALAMIPFLIKEARVATSGECGCSHYPAAAGVIDQEAAIGRLMK